MGFLLSLNGVTWRTVYKCEVKYEQNETKFIDFFKGFFKFFFY